MSNASNDYMNYLENAKDNQAEDDMTRKDRIAPPEGLDSIAAFISSAMTALFHELDASRNIRFKVRFAPELFGQFDNDYFVGDVDEPYEFIVARIPADFLNIEAEHRTPFLLRRVCGAYIATCRRKDPTLWRDIPDPAKELALDALNVKPESLAAARRMLWN